ncbi:UbiA family prenyltransferase [Paracraurococcus lichenis]|uniref:UbiA family prenyltransferase n=1 Tax=Paracraurococcus lichenis TaxID=3064888 RepID=A0ABT9DST4_9PROT|nr:UbiA family prenyltransferase [Paracraurococcus sp. LOR1-02]MDO9706960.1 UbiA family prenyltransferase [Paracraurococcus sp. LOR1-02]
MQDAAFASAAQGESRLLPLAVDLDGTLLTTDTLHEGLVAALLRDPASLPGLLASLPKGRAAFKRHVSKAAPANAAVLPLRQPFVEWLEDQRAQGRRLHLVTAADQSVADAIAQHLDIFDSATGSDGTRNLKGPEKAAWLRERFPEGFAYAGDSRADLAVFAEAEEIVLVGAKPDVAAKARRLGHAEVLAEFPPQASPIRDWIGAMRIHQWSKNALLFVPLVLGHKLGDPSAILDCLLGLILMGLTASGTYLLNDIADLPSDRLHRTKCNRAVAAGRIPPLQGLAGAIALVAMGLIGAAVLNPAFALGLLGYVCLSLTYSAFLKRIALLDTLTIGGLFTLRLALGVELAGVPYSPWLMAFAGFFFFSCALAKRHGELIEARDMPGGGLARRGYEVEDWPLTLGFGAASAMAALQIMILYVANEAAPSRLYHHAAWLYVAPAALAVWVVRIWMLSHRRILKDDPVVFALRDPWSWGIGAVIAAAIVAAL